MRFPRMTTGRWMEIIVIAAILSLGLAACHRFLESEPWNLNADQVPAPRVNRVQPMQSAPDPPAPK